ncbi:MAG: DUF2961 domain-containing protein [Candidatus Aminicenantes bacterium]|nr:DUF2961 domain-containing protein [Candidatus Aminicenantes bacterium]MBL7083238.1 DUF2961 domain-containing protein [Candidatus Aminicenantes bacterium]
MQKNCFFVFIILLILSFISCGTLSLEKEAITTGTLFEEMIDLVKLANFPDPSFRTMQYSSFDRRSNLPGGQDWFANSDGFGKEPIPNFQKILKEPDEDGIGEYLISDVKGPGAIVRLWSAAISGKIQLFIDGQLTPLYDGPANDFFHRVYDSFPDVNKLNLDRLKKTIYQRDAAYAPIPFAKSMRLVWIGNLQTIHFYQVQVRLYEPGTKIISFSPEDLSTYSDVINRVTEALYDPDQNLAPHSKEPAVPFESTLDPSKQTEILSLDGPKAIEVLSLQLKADNMDKALRQTLLHILCDDYPWGQVQTPVGDFFGAAPGINPYQSLPFTVNPDGTMICRYVMPFKKTFKMRIENHGDQTVKIKGFVLPMAFTWDEKRSMHFRARWRTNHNLIASNKAVQDLPFLLANGKGLYVGTSSYILNPNNVPTPYGNWWGEGDEKIFVDDDKVPSIFGTGSEDYYNYSWSSPDIFYFPYCGQPRNDGPGNRGFVTNFRWHILDPLPFQNNIRFFLELYSHERTPGLSYARIGYHYARPGLTDDHLAIMPEDLRHLQLPENWQPASRMGARNSVFYNAEKIVKSKLHTRYEKGRLWAGGKLLVWNPPKKGESLTFIFRAKEKGEKRIHIAAALTPYSGKISILVDNKPTTLANKKEIINLYRPFRTLLRNFTLPPMELKPGKHTLTLKFEGAEPGIKKPAIGIDFIWIQKSGQN